jgi:hypothetical protein
MMYFYYTGNKEKGRGEMRRRKKPCFLQGLEITKQPRELSFYIDENEFKKEEK